jgi:hypothetical protein
MEVGQGQNWSCSAKGEKNSQFQTILYSKRIYEVVIPGAVEFTSEKRSNTEFLERIHNKSLHLRNESNRTDCKFLHLNQASI